MKKLFLISILFLFVASVAAQDSFTVSEASGLDNNNSTAFQANGLSEKDIANIHALHKLYEKIALASGDCIYMVKDGGWVTCMDSQTGKLHFQERLGAPGACIASPVAANGYIYLSSYNGVIKVIEAGKKPNVVFEAKLKGKITATPAIVENNMYIRTSDYLYAFSK